MDRLEALLRNFSERLSELENSAIGLQHYECSEELRREINAINETHNALHCYVKILVARIDEIEKRLSIKAIQS